ncbi:MAG TPA: hypothetical protein VHV77_13930 [Pirellulales bacterium]|nr:hypothetical protein [Pirellulales bacterium]
MGVLTVPAFSIAYHRWQMDRAYARVYEFGPDGESLGSSEDLEQCEFHRDRLVKFGVLSKLDYTFQHLQNPSPQASALFRLVFAKQCPPLIDLNSPHPPNPLPMQITIWCDPSEASNWTAFLRSHDSP